MLLETKFGFDFGIQIQKQKVFYVTREREHICNKFKTNDQHKGLTGCRILRRKNKHNRKHNLSTYIVGRRKDSFLVTDNKILNTIQTKKKIMKNYCSIKFYFNVNEF